MKISRKFNKLFFTFTTERQVKVRDKRIILIHRLTQLFILIYVFWYQLIYNKAYQVTDTITSTTTTKVKGTGTLHYDDNDKLLFNSNDAIHVFDTSEFVIPANEYEATFLMTNFIKTHQTIGKCGENPFTPDAQCTNDSYCSSVMSKYHNHWHGIPTGKCLAITNETSVCEVYTWCPVEMADTTRRNVINGTLNYTIFVRNSIEFQGFHKKESNILLNMTNDYISNCINHKIRDPLCPIFSVDTVLREAEKSAKQRKLMTEKGGILQIEIQWDCQYDIFSPKCFPKYNFHRLDVEISKRSTVNSGFNFRFANKFMLDNQEHRILYKAYGLRVIISISGQAAKFSLLNITVAIGSGMGLLVISSLIADFFLLKIVNEKEFYKKFKEVQFKDAQEALSESLTL